MFDDPERQTAENVVEIALLHRSTVASGQPDRCDNPRPPKRSVR
jgi:hypothetical protein